MATKKRPSVEADIAKLQGLTAGWTTGERYEYDYRRDPVSLPEEKDVINSTRDFQVTAVVDMSCPLCEAPMTAVLKDRRVRFPDRTEDFYTVTSKQCDCPSVYLQYGA